MSFFSDRLWSNKKDESSISENNNWILTPFNDERISWYSYKFDADLSGQKVVWVEWNFIAARKQSYNIWLWEQDNWFDIDIREIENWTIQIIDWWIRCTWNKTSNQNVIGQSKEDNESTWVQSQENKTNILTIRKGYIIDEDDFLPIWDWTWEYYIKGWNWIRDESMWEKNKWREIWKKEIWDLKYENWNFIVKNAPWFNLDSFSPEEREQYEELLELNWKNWSTLNSFVVPLEENWIYFDDEWNINILPFEAVSYNDIVNRIVNNPEEYKKNLMDKFTFVCWVMGISCLLFLWAEIWAAFHNQVDAFNSKILSLLNSSESNNSIRVEKIKQWEKLSDYIWIELIKNLRDEKWNPIDDKKYLYELQLNLIILIILYT